MRLSRDAVRREAGRVWAASPTLTAVSLLCVPALAGFLVGLVADDRLITGNPAWLKPAKFAASSGLYCLTLAWIAAQAERQSRLFRAAGAAIGWVLVVEVGIIAVQAARGTTSHFNKATPLDASLFAVMGLSIAALLAASVVVTCEFGRARFADRAWGWALRLGMGVTVIGSTTGGFMVIPTAAQVAAATPNGHMPITGAHTVGGGDGGPGMVGTGWSRDHGDLRVPHFVGLHAVQAIPLLAWLAFRGFRPRGERARLALVVLIALSFFGLLGVLTVQALAGRPLLGGDVASLQALGVWALVTGAGFVAIVGRDRSRVEVPRAAYGA